MDYCLDTGDGTASIWTSAPDLDLDGDGELDAVRMDFDGDGLFDDALGDRDGDGWADHAALGLGTGGLDPGDGTGVLYTDDGTGTWAVAGGVAARPPRWFGLDGVEHPGEGATADVDGDGRREELLDVDRDGLADRALAAEDDGPARTGYVDTDGDGRWDLLLRDGDGDGIADGAGTI